MSKSAVDEWFAAEDHCYSTMIIAIFPTVNRNFKYFVEKDRCNALQWFTAEKLDEIAPYPPNLM
jgi:hypothetical protein